MTGPKGRGATHRAPAPRDRRHHEAGATYGPSLLSFVDPADPGPFEKPSLRDLALVSVWLRKERPGVDGIARRDALGRPAVLYRAPIGVDRDPFPTLFWLASPELVAAVSAVEARSGVRAIEERIAADPALRERFAAEQEIFSSGLLALVDSWTETLPWETLPWETRTSSSIPGGRSRFEGLGIGGVSNRTHVKCLHAHVAFALAGGASVAADLAFEEIGGKP